MTENRSKTVVIIALCLTLIFMGVGFAGLSQQLNINTTGTVLASEWDVHFDEFKVESKTGGSQVTAEVVSSEATAVVTKFTLSKPGDSVTFKGSISNAGSLNAKLGSAVEDNFDGQGYVTKTITGPSALGDALAATTGTAEVVITYKYTGEGLPEKALNLTDTIVYNYVQAD